MTEALRKAALVVVNMWGEPASEPGNLSDAIEALRAALSTPEISGQEILDNLTPEPILDDATGEEWCGRCWFVEHRRTLMAPCTPETCPDEQPSAS